MNRTDRLRLWYERAASRWEETLPIGNGSLGAMIWGGAPCEVLGLNEESLWSGWPRDRNNPGARGIRRELSAAGQPASGVQTRAGDGLYAGA